MPETQPYTISPLGDSAIVIAYGAVIDMAINRKVLIISNAIKEANFRGVKDVAPAYSSITVHYDVVAIRKANITRSAFEIMKEQLERQLNPPLENLEEIRRTIRIPVCYAPKYGLDLNHISAQLNVSIAEIVRLHTSKPYRVFMVGFLPGFAYMGELDERIAVPRKQEPRLQIEPGYVGIAGKQTGIYPLTSPGGWQIIGRTPVQLFDATREEPVLFTAGDEVEFYSITEDEFDNY
ncbi:5-oxoprolinase subunit PxpB [Segetibacter aerophilus]|uniref:Allophanate hydrolase n=1 Tax=Segetibacter aerophilus TaxID=670293 RepID=A0A512BHS7_9BACT|nr:5-oxoprolinase subunit PxpB [Segetibacter aerophilus]GEO11503.1 allophanate hydrolase [Segetibacter aerophilus]